MSPESRSRMISFRLTADEYDRVRELCYSNGIRSVSEMARAAINMMLSKPNLAPHEALEIRVTDLESRLHHLALEIKKLSQHSSRNVNRDVAATVRTA